MERDGEMAAAGEAPASCSGGEMAALLGTAPWWLAAVGAWGGAAAGGVPNTASAPLRGVGVAAGARRRRADGETCEGGGGGGRRLARWVSLGDSAWGLQLVGRK